MTKSASASLPPLSSVVDAIHAELPDSLKTPVLAIVCGSGLAGLSDKLTDRVDVPYERIPGFPVSTVVGHRSKLSFGRLAGVPVVAQAGRYHFYEGKDISLVTFPVRVFHALGCKAVILTNAAGGLHSNWSVPTICVLHDHIAIPALAGLNPLIGPNDDSIGPRFPPMSNAYDLELQKTVYRATRLLGQPDSLVRSGTYAWVTGPTYETRADCKFLRDYCGADVVGMSTVPEVIVARHAGMKVLCLSLVTNLVVGSPYRDLRAEVAAESDSQGGSSTNGAAHGKVAASKDNEPTVCHEEVLEIGAKAAEDMSRLVEKVVELAAASL